MEDPRCRCDYENKMLVISDEKCGKCPFKYQCKYLLMATDDVVYGGD